jgi:hypothetical protein
MLLLSCSNNGNSKIPETDNSNTSNEIAGQQKSDNPKFLFEYLSYNFGEITQGEQVNCIFKFKNVGNSNLLIYSAKSTCECTSLIFSEKPILPEEEGEIIITFDPKGKNGNITTNVVVSANTYPANVLLTLSANVVN